MKLELPLPLQKGLNQLALRQNRDPNAIVQEAIAQLLIQELPLKEIRGVSEYIDWVRKESA